VSQPSRWPGGAGYEYDLFITHDWGDNGENHARVVRFNSKLRELGFRTWLDTERMHGNIDEQMANGIDRSAFVLVIITERYCAKVNGPNAGDNCKREFNYAALKKTGARMVAVVVEPGMRNPRSWGGTVGLTLGKQLYVDLSEGAGDAGRAAWWAGLLPHSARSGSSWPSEGALAELKAVLERMRQSAPMETAVARAAV